MDKYRSEMFGEFTYSQSLTYEELIAGESELIENLEGVFKDSGGEHVDFTPLGDLLMTQCAFEVQNLEIFRDIAQEIAYFLPAEISARLMCLQKNLKSYHLFWIKRGEWQEKEYRLQITGPDDAPAHKIIIPPAEDILAEKAQQIADNQQEGKNIALDKSGENNINKATDIEKDFLNKVVKLK